MAVLGESEIVSFSPATLEPVGSVRRTDGAEVPDLVERAAVVVSAETGKPGTEALTQDVYPAVDHAVWLARQAAAWRHRRELLHVARRSLRR